VAAAEEERVIAGRLAAIGVTRGVADRIGFRLDDAPAEDALRRHPHHDLADQASSELYCVDG